MNASWLLFRRECLTENTLVNRLLLVMLAIILTKNEETRHISDYLSLMSFLMTLAFLINSLQTVWRDLVHQEHMYSEEPST